ncbi:MAG TPA: triose-phosphate isomerase [Mycobacteriales bacterium]|nr:triose-phosphate isomerase [Mycobacteriales bacterium]
MSKTPARRRLIAGNWKMNLNHLEAIALVQKVAFSLTAAELEAVEVVILPPFVSLRSVQTLIEGDRLLLGYGAQDLSPHTSGAYTGDVSGQMLAKLGCGYVLVGHSERREHHHEDDAVVNAKVRAAYRFGLTPILCVGEPAEAREAGAQVPHVVGQLDAALKGVKTDQASTLVVAYEPVWAIGTGKVASGEDAQQVCAAVRTRLAERFTDTLAEGVRILYGGSVKAANTEHTIAQPDVDGMLVGGASLAGEEFAQICRVATGLPPGRR